MKLMCVFVCVCVCVFLSISLAFCQLVSEAGFGEHSQAHFIAVIHLINCQMEEVFVLLCMGAPLTLCSALRAAERGRGS